MASSDWPRWLYKPTGEAQVFQTAADVPADDGWQEHGEVYDENGMLRADEAAVVTEIEALRAELTARAIDFDGRWGAAKLKAALDAAPAA